MMFLDTIAGFAGGFLEPRYVAWAAGALVLDGLIGDPVFPWHPIRLLGRLLTALENGLFRLGLHGYGGGILLFVLLTISAVGLAGGLLATAAFVHPWALHGAAVLVLWACIALRDLIVHGERVRRAAQRGDLAGARTAISYLVGRDTDRMDEKACVRGAVESIAENTVDGVLSPLFYACLFGPLGAVVFKVASTMDSMVGYKTERYLRFGWCGARTDDVLNYPVARLSYLGFVFWASLLPGFQALKAARIGWTQHAVVPGPNSGWPEATLAGAIGRRLIGPLYKNGVQVCDLWLGDPTDAPAGESRDLFRTYALVFLLTLSAVALATVVALFLHPQSPAL